MGRKRVLVVRYGFKAYEIDYSDMMDYEIVVVSSDKTYVVSSHNKALKGALLFGSTGAIVGAANSKTTSETVEMAELIVRLKFKDKESFEILTCNYQYEVADKEWRDVVDQSKVIDEFLKELID